MKQVLCYPYWPDKKAETSPSDSGCHSTQQGRNTDFQLTWSASELLLLAVFFYLTSYIISSCSRGHTQRAGGQVWPQVTRVAMEQLLCVRIALCAFFCSFILSSKQLHEVGSGYYPHLHVRRSDIQIK